MQSDWEAEALKLGYHSEEEMWKALYPQSSMTQLAEKFKKGINTIRNRIDHYKIEKRSRGGANNVKVEINKEMLDDVISLGVQKAAVKYGIKPQALYQRLYYKYGTSVKQLKEQARLSVSSLECDSEQQLSEESDPDVQGDK